MLLSKVQCHVSMAPVESLASNSNTSPTLTTVSSPHTAFEASSARPWPASSSASSGSSIDTVFLISSLCPSSSEIVTSIT